MVNIAKAHRLTVSDARSRSYFSLTILRSPNLKLRAYDNLRSRWRSVRMSRHILVAALIIISCSVANATPLVPEASDPGPIVRRNLLNENNNPGLDTQGYGHIAMFAAKVANKDTAKPRRVTACAEMGAVAAWVKYRTRLPSCRTVDIGKAKIASEDLYFDYVLMREITDPAYGVLYVDTGVFGRKPYIP